MVLRETFPALLVLGFDSPVKALIFIRPIRHTRQARGHWGFKANGLRMNVGDVGHAAFGMFAVRGKRPETHRAVRARAKIGNLFVGAAFEFPDRRELNVRAVQDSAESAGALHRPHR